GRLTISIRCLRQTYLLKIWRRYLTRGCTTACEICARSYILTARAKGGCDNMTTLNGGNDDKINVGDIVHIDGYGDKEFEIISIERTYYIDANYEYEATEVESLGLHDKRNYYANRKSTR